MKRLFEQIRSRWLSLLGGTFGAIVIGVVFFVVLPSIASPREVWEQVKSLTWYWLVALVLAALLNVVTFAPPYMAALPGLKFRPALAVTTASTASTYIAPGGPAVGMGLAFAMLRGWGFRGRPVTVAVTLTTVWNQFMVFGFPTIALAALTLEGGKNPLLQTAALIGFGVFVAVLVGFVLALRSERQAAWVGRIASTIVSRGLRLIRRKPVNWASAFVRFRRDTVGLLRTRWHWLTLATLAGHLTVYLVLILTLRAVNITADEVSLIESFAAWSLVRILGSIPITPGGFGIVELGLTGALVGFGASQAEAVAAVLLYRLLTVVPPIVFGAFFAATWRRHHPGAAEEIETAAASIESA
jgi:uncharacterized protein (TIRG00374 family)